MIEASGLRKHYRKKVAVDDISFSVKPNTVTGFLGPNGAGKSTTMRLMVGLDHGEGKTLFDGKALYEYPNPSKQVGVLLEAKAFHPTRSARNHLKVLAAAGDIPMKRVDEALDIVGLSDVAKKGPGKFSLGMSQRLGIAAAILGEPKHLLLDEPANGLDPEGIAWLREFITDYASKGKSVFISSHLLSEVSQMADNVVVIGKGRLIANTSIKQLISGGSSSVFVKAANMSKLKKALTEAKFDFTDENEGVVVNNAKPDQIGTLAFGAGTAVYELTVRQQSLEQAFLELTGESEEFHTKFSEHKK